MPDLKQQIHEQLYQSQTKYTYFLLAAAASAIALTVQRTTGQTLNWGHSILGIAIFIWGFSFYSGCRYRMHVHASLQGNYQFLRFDDGTHPLRNQLDTAQWMDLRKIMKEAAEINASKASKWSNRQF